MLAQCLGAAAVRAGQSVLFMRADALLGELGQARADHTFEKVFRRYLAPDLLILDDFGLRRLNAQQSNDLYELIIERHRRGSFRHHLKPRRGRVAGPLRRSHPGQ